MGYIILEAESIPTTPEVLKGKPRWMTCAAFGVATMAVITSAITIGIIVGYTYCYIEHRTGLRSANMTANTTNIHIVHVSSSDNPEVLGNRTINGAILSSVIVKKILKMAQCVVEDERGNWPGHDNL